MLTTVGGERYEGFIRWDRNETSWAHILHASKRIPEDHVRAGEALAGEQRRSRRGFEIFGVRVGIGGDRSEYPATASSGIRFGHILTLEPWGRDRARLVLISGHEVELRSGGDLGPSIREIVVEDPTIGEVELEWSEIGRVDFYTAPADLRPRSGERLVGTLETRLRPIHPLRRLGRGRGADLRRAGRRRARP